MHMPGVGELVGQICTHNTDLALAFPPGTLALIELESDHWRDLDFGAGWLRMLLPPLPVG